MNRFLLCWLLFIAGFGLSPSFAFNNDALRFDENADYQTEPSIEEAEFKANRLLFPPSGIPSLRIVHHVPHHLEFRKYQQLDIACFNTSSSLLAYQGCWQQQLVQTESALSQHFQLVFFSHYIQSLYCIWRK